MNKKIKLLLNLLILPFPWMIRRVLYTYLFKYKIDKTARIGRSIILAEKLTMKPFSKIGAFNFINELDYIFLDQYSKIGTQNWITGLSTKYDYNFTYSSSRECMFRLGKHARITKWHFIECSGGVTIGDFTTIAGIRSVFITHSIDIGLSRQTAGPLKIGQYCIVSTNCKLLKDTTLPDYSVLGAGAVLTKKYEEPYGLFAGTPARRLKSFNKTDLYFTREHGHVT